MTIGGARQDVTSLEEEGTSLNAKIKATITYYSEFIELAEDGKSIVLPDNDATRGMIRKVGYMLKVEEA